MESSEKFGKQATECEKLRWVLILKKKEKKEKAESHAWQVFLSSQNFWRCSELTYNFKVQTVCVFLKLQNYSTFV